MNTWQDDFKSAIKNTNDLKSFLDLSSDIAETNYPLFIPKNFLEKIKNAGPASPLWKQFIPNENENLAGGMLDPIGDQKFQVTKNLIHRYPNRALYIPTTVCPIVCRYCFRKNELYDQTPFKNDLEETLTYLQTHPEIEEIIFTGGDPFILSDEKLLETSVAFSKIKTIKFIRFHSRTPIILPNRVNTSFIETINQIKKLFEQVTIMVHVNHVDEIDSSVSEAFMSLKKSDALIFSQTVLLKDINDDGNSLRNLFLKLGTLGVIPYYLHHPDETLGTTHFRLTLPEGRKIYAKLRSILPGWLIPQYIYDIPGGEGKVSAFNPENFEFHGYMINLKGEKVKI